MGRVLAAFDDHRVARRRCGRSRGRRHLQKPGGRPCLVQPARHSSQACLAPVCVSIRKRSKVMLIDGLQCGHFTRETFAELRRADVGAVTVTCGFWEGTVESLDSIARWRDLVAANKDLVSIATTAKEVEAIAGAGRTAIILG